MLKVRVFTLYPELFPGPLDVGIYKKARKEKIWDLKVIDIRMLLKISTVLLTINLLVVVVECY